MSSPLVILILSLLLGLQPITTDLYLPALPALTAELGASMAQAQLTLTALLLAFGGSQLVWGPLSDRYGRRPILLVGMVAYVLASLASSLAPGMGWLIDPALLDEVRDAVVHARQLELAYTSRTGEVTNRLVEPLGLAAKAGTWYLIADTAAGLRTFRVDRIDHLAPTGRDATRPEGFDLAQAWSLIADRVEEMRTPVVAHPLVDEGRVRMLAFMLGERVRVGGAAPDGRVEVEVRGHHVNSLAAARGGQ